MTINLDTVLYFNFEFIYLEFVAGRVPTTVGFGTLGLPSYHVFTLEEMEDATDNFDPSNLIAEGSQGQVNKYE